MCAFFSELERVRGKDRGLTEGQTMCLYECKAVQILSVDVKLLTSASRIQPVAELGQMHRIS
jgi:hypothetical protein